MRRGVSGFIRFMRYVCVFTFVTIGMVAIVGTGGDSGGDGDGGGGGGGNSNTPQTYTASGTYTYDSDTGELVLNTTKSDFLGCGPSVGLSDEDVESITTTTMLLNQGEENAMTWTRDSGTADEIEGTWDLEQEGNTWEIILNADLTFSVTGKILTCKTKWNVVYTIDLDGMDTNFTCIPGDDEGDDTRDDYITIQQTGSSFTMTMDEFGQTINGTISGGIYTFSGSWVQPDNDGDYTITVNGSFTIDSASQVSGSDTVDATNDAGNYCTWDETFIGIED